MKNYTVIPTEAAEKLPLNDLYVFTALCLTAHDDNTTDVTYEQLAGFTGKSLGYIKDHFAKRLKNSGLCTIEEFVHIIVNIVANYFLGQKNGGKFSPPAAFPFLPIFSSFDFYK